MLGFRAVDQMTIYDELIHYDEKSGHFNDEAYCMIPSARLSNISCIQLDPLPISH